MKNSWSLYLFFAVSIVELIVVGFNLPFRFISKPVVMLSLMLFYYLNSEAQFKLKLSILLALLFAWFGDVFLLSSSESYFLFGLASFLIMHLIYSSIFFKQREIGVHKHLLPITGVLIITIIMNLILWPRTASLKIPVLVYSIAIALAAATAIMRWKTNGYYLVVAGALLFMFSDTLIAVKKFIAAFDYAELLIMLSYIIAQFMIVFGLIKGKS